MSTTQNKYWNEGALHNGGEGISLKALVSDDSSKKSRIMSLSIEEGTVIITEQCDGYFSGAYTKEQAIEALEEAIVWIKEQKI